MSKRGGLFDCYDCGVNTDMIKEYHMVKDSVWKASKVRLNAILCIGCLEKRLHRKLKRRDFSYVPINYLPSEFYSDRLNDRLGLAA